METNFKKTGLKLFILTIIALIVMDYFSLDVYLRIAAGTFGIGTSTILIFFGGIRPPEE